MTYIIALCVVLWLIIGTAIVRHTGRIRHVIAMISHEHPYIALAMLIAFVVFWPITVLLEVYSRYIKGI